MNIETISLIGCRLARNFVIIIQLSFAIISRAQDLELIRTETVEGYYFGVTRGVIGGTSTNNNPPDAKLCVGLWTTTNNTYSVFIPYEPEFAYEVELFDTNGIAMPKTDYGKRFGSKCLEWDTTFSNEGAKLQRAVVMREPDTGMHYLFVSSDRDGTYGYTYSPSDLFIVKKSGRYRLQIRFQMIVQTGSGLDRKAHIVRFPPLYYPLFKVDESPIKSSGSQ